MSTPPIVVVGIGQDGLAGLCPEARAHLAGAEILAGGKRHLAFFADFAGPRIPLDGDVPTWIEKLKARDPRHKTVILASGDPLFYGIGRALSDAFPREELVFVPHVSSVALAFARLKETWQDACVVSLHGRPLANLLPALQRRQKKIAILTDADNDPAAIARFVHEHASGCNYRLHVCENLGSAQERITQWTSAEPIIMPFAPLNVVVLIAADQRNGAPIASALPLLGLPEAMFQHRGSAGGGMITKPAVRVQALCELQLRAGDILWDVGSGSGSVAIEAARLSPSLEIYAVESEPAELRENLRRFDLSNIHLVHGIAPQALADLPNPDAVFIGGSGGRLVAILETAIARLSASGRLVVSCIAIETLSLAWTWLGEHGLEPHATSLQIAHARPLGNLHCFEPEHPIFLVRIVMP